MGTFSIERPVITIESLPNGDTTYKLSCQTWDLDYWRNANWSNPSDTRKKMKSFEKEFDAQASELEATNTRRYIMGAFVDNGVFFTKRALRSTNREF